VGRERSVEPPGRNWKQKERTVQKATIQDLSNENASATRAVKPPIIKQNLRNLTGQDNYFNDGTTKGGECHRQRARWTHMSRKGAVAARNEITALWEGEARLGKTVIPAVR